MMMESSECGVRNSECGVGENAPNRPASREALRGGRTISENLGNFGSPRLAGRRKMALRVTVDHGGSRWITVDHGGLRSITVDHATFFIFLWEIDLTTEYAEHTEWKETSI